MSWGSGPRDPAKQRVLPPTQCHLRAGTADPLDREAVLVEAEAKSPVWQPGLKHCLARARAIEECILARHNRVSGPDLIQTQHLLPEATWDLVALLLEKPRSPFLCDEEIALPFYTPAGDRLPAALWLVGQGFANIGGRDHLATRSTYSCRIVLSSGDRCRTDGDRTTIARTPSRGHPFSRPTKVAFTPCCARICKRRQGCPSRRTDSRVAPVVLWLAPGGIKTSTSGWHVPVTISRGVVADAADTGCNMASSLSAVTCASLYSPCPFTL